MTLRPSQLETLRVVARREHDGALAADVAEALSISTRSAEERLGRLARRGLVNWSPMSGGRLLAPSKAPFARLTPLGRKMLDG